MNPLSYLYTEILWRPLFNGLIWLYNVVPGHDLGVAIIILTIAIRLLLAPLLHKSQKAQKDLARLQPELKRLQEQFKNDREAQGRATMELYAKHKVNPFSGCIIMLIQLPILIALFQVFRSGFSTPEFSYLYSFITNPTVLNPVSFGLLDLSKGSLYLGVVASLTQYFQTKLSTPPPPPSSSTSDFSRIFQQQSLYIFPVIILVWSYTLPSALTLYWTVLNIFGILQELLMRRFSSRTSVSSN